MPGTASLVRALTGRMMVGSFANYGYYPDDDGVILHVDTEATEVVLLATALGSLGPLSVRPELRGRMPSELGELESDPQWDRAGGRSLFYPTFGAAALLGAQLPHHRVSKSRPISNISWPSTTALRIEIARLGKHLDRLGICWTRSTEVA